MIEKISLFGKMKISLLLTVCVFVAMTTSHASAANTIKVGFVVTLTGPSAESGAQIIKGVKTYMAMHGDTVAGKKIELIIKDAGGIAPALAKRHCQELVVKDKVDFIAGFSYTPNALACASIATESKTPMIVMNAATSGITTKSPYMVRTSFTIAQATAPLAEWAFKEGYREIFTIVSDYAPGIDAEKVFKEVFEKYGGKVVGEVRLPYDSPEYGPYLQRVKDSKPQAAFIFIPAGKSVPLMKSFEERGLKKAGIKLLAIGDALDDGFIEAMGDTPLGVISTQQYSAAHDSPENKAFLAAFKKLYPSLRPNTLSVGGYDGMAAIYNVVKQLNGNIDGNKAMQVFKGMKINSPRGPIEIDPETRDITQNIYVREAKKIGGKIYNVEFKTFKNVKASGK